MPSPAKPSKPARVPGDAEAPPRGESDRTAEQAVRRSDPTEPVQSEQNPGKDKQE